MLLEMGRSEIKVYTASWCTVWRALERQLGDVLCELTIVDVDVSPAEADRAQVAVVPTIVAKLPDGRVIIRYGAISADDMRSLIQSVRGE